MKMEICPLCRGAIESEELLIAEDRNVIVRNGQVALLTPQQMKVFLVLLRYRPQVVPPERLLSTLYDYGAKEPESGRQVLSTLIPQIRSEVMRLGLTLKTFYRKGYALTYNGVVRSYSPKEID